LFEFEEDGYRRKVIEGCPWSYDRTIIIIDKLEGKKPPSHMKLHHTPIWLQVHDIPLECSYRGVGTKIGESLGQVKEVVVVDDVIGWGRYLK
jgi:hypothetical protein